jgi:hypothetical protein
VASRWQPSGPSGTLLVCRNGHTMQFRLVNSPDTGLTVVCTVEGCGDMALRVARYQEWEAPREQPAGLPASGVAMAAASQSHPTTPVAPPPAAAVPRHPAPVPDNLQPPIHVHTSAAAHHPPVAAVVPPPVPPVAHAPMPPLPAANLVPAPAPVMAAVFSRDSEGPSIRDMIEHSPGFLESLAQGGHSQADFERVWPDGAPYEVPVGAIAGSLPLEVRGRPASACLPEGWRAWSAPEMVLLPVQGDRRHHLVMDGPDVGADRIFRLGMMTLPLTPPFDLLSTVLECERRYTLPIASRVVSLNFAGTPAYLWHVQGRVPGRILGKQEDLVPLHLSEMQSPIGRYVVQFTVIAPVERARDAVAAMHTVIGSWRWLA